MELFGDMEHHINRRRGQFMRTLYIKYGAGEHDSYIDHEAIPATSFICPNIPVSFKIAKNEFKMRNLRDVLNDLTDDD